MPAPVHPGGRRYNRASFAKAAAFEEYWMPAKKTAAKPVKGKKAASRPAARKVAIRKPTERVKATVRSRSPAAAAHPRSPVAASVTRKPVAGARSAPASPPEPIATMRRPAERAKPPGKPIPELKPAPRVLSPQAPTEADENDSLE